MFFAYGMISSNLQEYKRKEDNKFKVYKPLPDLLRKELIALKTNTLHLNKHTDEINRTFIYLFLVAESKLGATISHFLLSLLLCDSFVSPFHEG